MRGFLIIAFLLTCAHAFELVDDDDDVQQVQQQIKSVKGGVEGFGGAFEYNSNFRSLFGNRTQQGGYNQFNQQSGYQFSNQSHQSGYGQFNNQSGYNQYGFQGGFNQNGSQQNGYNQYGNQQQNSGFGQANNQRSGYGQESNQDGYGHIISNQGDYRQGGYNTRRNNTYNDVGVCYIEVPTASLVHDHKKVPVGNGSRPELSVIRGCCKGYIRNIHNFWKCDPVCTDECINALCTAPETCTCFPDHVKNLASICIPTCPIGCQNGQCSGGECLCKEGYQLDSDGKFCVPHCKEKCGGLGNCTAPNTCECKTGYKSSPEGACKPHCEHCTNGDCVKPNECQCHQGFKKNQQGICAPHCQPGYKHTPEGCKAVCDHQCINGDCVAPNVCSCHNGYTLAPGDTSRCVILCKPGFVLDEASQRCKPTCSPSCVNGDCISPNVCSCHEGYTLSQGDSVQCVPVCIPICAGRCIKPNVCDPPSQPYLPSYHQPNHPSPSLISENQRGDTPRTSYQPSTYDNNGNQMYQVPNGVPQCSQPCLNGFCVGDNRCSCNPGHVLDRNDASGSRCIPNCPGGCPNGICSAPNFCICNMGYYKDHSTKGRPTCVKREKRSVDPEEFEFKTDDYKSSKKPSNVADLLVFEIPDY